MHFRGDLELGLFWNGVFPTSDCVDDEMRLVCDNTLEFTLMSLLFENSRLREYARDALHFALIAEYRDHSFWSFLLSDTYNLEDLFGFDQLDLVITVMLLIEWLSQQGIYLPRTCYEPSTAMKDDMEVTSDSTRRFLRSCHFVPFGFALSP